VLQQTQVTTVIPYFEKFMRRFPDVHALAAAPLDDVLAQWSGLGYYRRARHMHESAITLSQNLKRTGAFPQTEASWLALKGVGAYTVGAILSIAFHQPRAILDGNVERVLSRLLMLRRTSTFKRDLWDASLQWIESAFAEKVDPSDFNQALMELGALICTPANPQCPKCPLEKACGARKAGKQLGFPEPTPRKKWVKLNEEMHLIVRGDPSHWEGLLLKTKASEWRGGLWDLLPDPAFQKSKFEKLKALSTHEIKLVVTHHKILRKIRVWKCANVPQKKVSEELRWVPLSEFSTLPHGSGLRKSLKTVLADPSLS